MRTNASVLRFCRLAAASLVVLAHGGCKKPEPSKATGESCSVVEDGHVVHADGRRDGIYGVQGGELSRTPLATFEQAVRTSEGIDPANGKRWVRVRLADDGAKAVRAFTADPNGKKLAIVSGGEVTSMHTVRVALTSAEFQVSCCDPRACDRWNAVLEPPK